MDRNDFNNLIFRLRETHRFSEVVELLRYINDNISAFTQEQLDEIEPFATDLMESFTHPRCKNVEQIKLIFPGWEPNYYGDKVISMCTRAEQMRMTLPDYIHRIHGANDFFLYFYRDEREEAGGFAGIARQIVRTNQNTREIVHAMGHIENEIENLRSMVVRPYQEGTVHENEPPHETVNQAPPPETYTADIVFTPREFQILNRTPGAYEHTLVRREGRNYVVRITDRTKGDVDNFVFRIQDEAEKEIAAERERRKPTGPSYSNVDFENIQRILCGIYNRQFPDYQCPTSITALARRIAAGLNALGLNWDSNGVDIGSIDLFLKSNPDRVYSRELADEVYNQFFANLEFREQAMQDRDYYGEG